MSDGYLSDDMESRLIATAPIPCRICFHLYVKISIITDKPIVQCGLPEDAPNADILAKLLYRLAKSGECDFFAPISIL